MLRPPPGPDSLGFDALLAAWATDLHEEWRRGSCASIVPVALMARVAAGEGAPGEADAVHAHLATCLPCLSAYAELASAAFEGPDAGAEEPPAPLAGRAAEIGALVGLLERAASGGCEIAWITGDAGIGKTRLLDAVCREAETRGAHVLRAHCSPVGGSVPYRPLCELFGALCGTDDRMSGDTARARIAAALGAAGLSVAGLLPFVVGLTGRGRAGDFDLVPDPSVMKDKLAQVLRGLIAAASQSQAVVVAVEDLQWCDAASADCLARVLADLRGGRALFVGTSRPGWEAEWLSAAAVHRVAIAPLGEPEARVVLRRMVGADRLSAAVEDAVLARAAGNPLMLHELALALRARVALDDGAPWPGADAGVIRARIRELPVGARGLLEAAAVIGLDGPVPLLRQLAPEWDGRALARLREEGFVIDANGVFRFRHALIQEVAYAGAHPATRERLHEAAARALDGGAGADDAVRAETVAHHFARSAADEPAVDSALRAAAQMLRRAANAEGLAILGAARRRLDDMPDTPENRARRIDVVLAEGEARFGLGRHGEQLGALEAVRGLVEGSADPRRRATWHYWMGFLQVLTGGSPAVAASHCRAASTIADAAGIDDIYAYSESCLSQVLAMAGDLRGAMDAGKRALAVFEGGRNAWWTCRTLWHLASAALAQGQWHDSAALCERALELGRAAADPRLMAVAWLRLGAAHVHRGQWQTGVLYCDEAARLTHTAFDGAMLQVNRGYGLVRGGQHAPGIASIESGLDWFRRAGLHYSQLLVEVRLAESLVRAGDAGRAAHLAAGSLAAARRAGYRHVEGIALAVLGDALSASDPVAAPAVLSSALDVLEEVGAMNDVARVKVAQARLARGAGDRAGERALLRGALGLFEALETMDEAEGVRAALSRSEGRPLG